MASPLKCSQTAAIFSTVLGAPGSDVWPNQQQHGALVYLNMRDYRACYSPHMFPGLPVERTDLLTLSDMGRR